MKQRLLAVLRDEWKLIVALVILSLSEGSGVAWLHVHHWHWLPWWGGMVPGFFNGWGLTWGQLRWRRAKKMRLEAEIVRANLRYRHPELFPESRQWKDVDRGKDVE